jgi:hypothetical protein
MNNDLDNNVNVDLNIDVDNDINIDSNSNVNYVMKKISNWDDFDL